jgi:hypothetical protein
MTELVLSQSKVEEEGEERNMSRREELDQERIQKRKGGRSD